MQTPNGMFAFTIGNPYEGKRKRRGGRYVSTKKDKMNHGIGLASVEDIVKKYRGIMEISDDHHYFEVSLCFSITESRGDYSMSILVQALSGIPAAASPRCCR